MIHDISINIAHLISLFLNNSSTLPVEAAFHPKDTSFKPRMLEFNLEAELLLPCYASTWIALANILNYQCFQDYIE